MVKSVKLYLSTSRLSSSSAPVSGGIPFGRGILFDTEDLCLIRRDGTAVPAYIRVASRWDDRSVKWVHVYFTASPQIQRDGTLQLCIAGGDPGILPKSTGFGLRAERRHDHIRIENERARFDVDRASGMLDQVWIAEAPQLSAFGSRIVMYDASGARLRPEVDSVEIDNDDNPFQRTILMRGRIESRSGGTLVNFTQRLTFFADLATVRVDFSILNPRAAEHRRGVWDLGDKGSVHFDGLSIELSSVTDGGSISRRARSEFGLAWHSVESEHYCIYQESSGGENWHNHNHVNASGRIPLSFRGYHCCEDGSETARGLRADPEIRILAGNAGVGARLHDFWQNFPKAIEVEGALLRIQLFPRQFADAFELQGGEQKTHVLYLSFGDDENALDWSRSPPVLRAELEHVAGTALLPYLQSHREHPTLQALIDRGLDGANDFFTKREIADEFGWRNFGDIYADHEELEYREPVPLVSHYNNQYDVLDGILRQYLISGRRGWFDLAAALARHVVDIDIYKTREDRDEYNGGLFWHTDHYSNAHTATHRTFSAKNSHSYDGKVGGGPGTEHCYTTGLVNCYWLTGERDYRDAAMILVDWIHRSFEGSGTVFERLHRFLTRDLATIRQLAKGRRVPRYRYPLTRATGNYLASMLDAYQLTGDRLYLERCAKIIRSTLHPRDEIETRGLDNVELGWSYLVFLQSVCKYLAVKLGECDADADFRFARACLLHYAAWIAQNERPFLDSREQLDFPNLTWVAQDLRKSYVLRVAVSLGPEIPAPLLRAAEFFEAYVAEQLDQGEKNYYTRILAILMQNFPPDCSVFDAGFNRIEANDSTEWIGPPILSIPRVFADFTIDLMRCLRRFSPARELRWLKFRIKSL